VKDFSGDLADLAKRVSDAQGYLRIADARVRRAELEQVAAKPDLWDDPDAARKVTTELARVSDDVDLYERLSQRLSDAQTLEELAREESDDSVEGEIAAAIADLAKELDALELRALFSGEHDDRDAICSVNSGAGGTDAQDWAEMLLRMYLRWAERRGLAVEVDEVTEGDEAGISSATFTVKGRYAFGMLRAERGVHRLVRISPFDAQSRRHTAFAALDAIPALEEQDEVEIDTNDLRIDTFRSSGAGGQHVNTTDSAVRLTHIPTGIVVQCQSERSQHKNRATAWKMLRARLYERELEEREAAAAAEAASKSDIGWGHQIRSYVLQPYQLVKDLRTGKESTSPQDVLNGDLTPFMEASLAHRIGGDKAAEVADLQ